jgi:CubicO group peptidase (beta-lactamase class C family)
MNHLAFVCLLVFVLFVQSKPQNFTKEIDAIFAHLDKPTSPGCSVGIIENGRLLYTIKPSTSFALGSVSKQFTAMGIAILQEEGKLNVNDDIRKYLPEMPNYGHTITISHLIHHTSGIRDWPTLALMSGYGEYFIFKKSYPLELLSRQKALNFIPGSKGLYSNSNYSLLGLIIERITKMSLREFTKKYITDRLQMNRTFFKDDRTEIVNDYALGYNIGLDGKFHTDLNLLEDVGSTGLETNQYDFLLYDRNFYQNKLGKGGQNLIKIILNTTTLNDGTPVPYAYGLLINKYGNLNVIEHGGAVAGYRSYMARFPEKRLTINVFCNVGIVDTQEITYKIASVFGIKIPKSTNKVLHGMMDGKFAALSSNMRNTKIGNLTNDKLKEYIGYYLSDELKVVYDVKLGNGFVYFEIKNLPVPFEMYVKADDTWSSNLGAEGKFTRDSNKKSKWTYNQY